MNKFTILIPTRERADNLYDTIRACLNQTYSNYFVVTQGCTVGANAKLEYPELGENIVMYPHSSILGNSKISSNVVCSNNSMVLNKNIKSNSIIVGQHPNVDTKEVQTDIFSQFFIKE